MKWKEHEIEKTLTLRSPKNFSENSAHQNSLSTNRHIPQRDSACSTQPAPARHDGLERIPDQAVVSRCTSLLSGFEFNQHQCCASQPMLTSAFDDASHLLASNSFVSRQVLARRTLQCTAASQRRWIHCRRPQFDLNQDGDSDHSQCSIGNRCVHTVTPSRDQKPSITTASPAIGIASSESILDSSRINHSTRTSFETCIGLILPRRNRTTRPVATRESASIGSSHCIRHSCR